MPGQPYWIPDPTQPAGRTLNPAAFSSPPAGMTGDFPRNGLRSPYSINQTDLAVRRQFSLTERVKLDVREEYFNVFNHPMFGISGSLCNPDQTTPTASENLQLSARYAQERRRTAMQAKAFQTGRTRCTPLAARAPPSSRSKYISDMDGARPSRFPTLSRFIP